MRLDHEFTVPVPRDQAWSVLLDIERIAPCLPGAVIDTVADDGFTGRVKVKVGPITVSYAGEGRFVETDRGGGRVLIEAGGKETRGSGTAKATIAAQLHDEGSSTRVTVQTDLSITGKPAQFGRGVMVDVGGKLLGRFADCLAERLASGPEVALPSVAVPEVAASSAGEAAAAEPPSPPGPAGAEPVPIDLLGAAGGPLLRRLLPVLGGVAALVLLLVAGRRRRRRR